MLYIYIFIYYICNIWATALLAVVLNTDHSNRHENLVLIKALTLSIKCLIHQKEEREREKQRPRSNHPSGPVPSISYAECRVSPVELNTHTKTHIHTHIHKTAGRSSSDHASGPALRPGLVKLGRLCYKTVRVK